MIMPPVCIRRAVAQDLDAIDAIEHTCFDDDAFSRPQLAYLIGKAQGVCYVACSGKRVVGYISLLTRRNAANVRIYSVAVDPMIRNFGAGRALVAEAIAHAQREGLREVTLEVRTDNTSAIALYTRNGFVAGRLLKAYYHDGADAWRMRLRLKK